MEELLKKEKGKKINLAVKSNREKKKQYRREGGRGITNGGVLNTQHYEASRGGVMLFESKWRQGNLGTSIEKREIERVDGCSGALLEKRGTGNSELLGLNAR